MTRLFVFVSFLAALWLFGRGVSWIAYRADPELMEEPGDRYLFMAILVVLGLAGLFFVGLIVAVLWSLAGAVAE